MRIAIVTYEFPPETPAGGIGTYSVQWARLLAREGERVEVFAGSHIGTRTTEEDGVRVHRVACRDPHEFREAVVPVFSAVHRQTPFDLVESAEINGNALGIKQLFPNLPLVVRLHAGNYLVERLKKRFIPLLVKLRFVAGALRRGRLDPGYWRKYEAKDDPDYRFTELADHITAPSPAMKAWAVRHWRLAPEKIHIVENTLVPDPALSTARTVGQEKVILFYGRLNVLKGMVTATRAMKKILTRNPDWTWIVAGDDGPGPEGRESMESWMQAQLVPVRQQVSFLPSQRYEDIPGLLRQASVVLVPSLFESFSYVAFESLYAGKAVIGSRGTGIESLITEGKNGLLADPLSVREWTTAIQRFIDDECLRNNLSAAAVLAAEEALKKQKKLVDRYRELVQPNMQLLCV